MHYMIQFLWLFFWLNGTFKEIDQKTEQKNKQGANNHISLFSRDLVVDRQIKNTEFQVQLKNLQYGNVYATQYSHRCYKLPQMGRAYRQANRHKGKCRQNSIIDKELVYSVRQLNNPVFF